MKTAENYLEGQVLLIDKPYTWTSFQAVSKLKYILRKQFNLPKNFKIGHAGTLDPLATGLLIICTGKATKSIESFMGLEKEYTGEICLGATTPCFDLEKPIDKTFDISNITEDDILKTAKSFLGESDQVPPIFSAIQIDGKRAYELARSGESVELKSRKIIISEFEIVKIEMPKFQFRIKCSKGTYIRSIARDFGVILNNGAHLTALRRTKIGEFMVENATSPENFIY